MTQHYETFKMLKLFEFDHLSEDSLRITSKKFYVLAHDLVENLPDDFELRVGLRKLLEAKDWFVRSALELTDL